ncbi:MAG: hypothetical protein WBE26_08085 [Phycisphaerae bacterium]
MRERFQLPLPMWRVQYQLLGGYRRLAAIVVICAVVLVAGIFGIRRIFLQDPFPTVAGWILNILAAIQVFAVILGGCSAVFKAMLRDYESKMIESHRLTPMSNMTIVFGYLLGSTLQITLLFVLFTAVGAVVSFAARLPVDAWVYGNLFLLNGAITLWSIVLFSGMRLEKPFNPTPLLVGVAALTLPIAFVPGAALLLNTYSILFAIWIITGTVTVAMPAVVIVAAVNLGFTAFWLSAAAAKYRRPDLPALNAGRGLVLLLLALIVSTAGIVAFDSITLTGMPSFYEHGLPKVQWIATMIGALVLAAVPVGGAVKCRMLVARGSAPRDWSDRVSDLLVALLAAALICAVMAALGTSIWWDLLPPPADGLERAALFVRMWLYSAAACVLATLSVRSVIEIAQPFAKSANALIGIFITIAWAIPPLADFARAEYLREFRDTVAYSWLMGCSPAGTIIATWSPLDAPLQPGLLVQLALMLVLVYVARRVRTKSMSLSVRTPRGREND